MPEQEFDLYLSLLVKLLRLSPEQKKSIEAELRDHFEERFEALVRSGVARDVAIRRTLDEFGDVAGLANEFTHLSRKHIRRRIMQGTMATAGVAAAVVIWATLFRGPEPAVGPAPNVVAQEDAAAENPTPTAPATGAATSQNGQKIEWIDPGQFLPAKLRAAINVEFAGIALRDVITYISEMSDLPILMDTASLSAAGITGEEEVTVNLKGLPVHTALTVLLAKVNDVELAWMENAEVVRITTKERADVTFTTEYYNVRDLLNEGYTQVQILNVIRQMTDGPWEDIDGVGGNIGVFGDLLVAKQCQRTQVDVACTLAGLRSKAPLRLVGELPVHAKLHAALDMPINIEFTGTALRDVITYVAEISGQPFVMDTPELSAAGITGEEEVTLNVKGVKLRSALALLLEKINDVELSYTIRNGLFVITTKDVADNALHTVFYDLADITDGDLLLQERLEEVVRNQTGGPWEDIDGIGGLLIAPTPRLLACRQSQTMQAEVRNVLAAVRSSLDSSGGDRTWLAAASTKLETRFYRMDAEAAADVARLIPALIEPETWKPTGLAIGMGMGGIGAVGVGFGGSGNVAGSGSAIPFGGSGTTNTSDDGQAGSGTVSAPAEPIGTIRQLAAGRMLLQLDSGKVIDSAQQHQQTPPGGNFSNPQPGAAVPNASASGSQESAGSNVVVIPQAILIITHKPAVLRQVSRLLQSLLANNQGWTTSGGDGKVRFISPGYQEGIWRNGPGGPVTAPPGMMGGGMGGGGGGFGGGAGGGGGGFGGGGGLFSIQSR